MAQYAMPLDYKLITASEVQAGDEVRILTQWFPVHRTFKGFVYYVTSVLDSHNKPIQYPFNWIPKSDEYNYRRKLKKKDLEQVKAKDPCWVCGAIDTSMAYHLDPWCGDTHHKQLAKELGIPQKELTPERFREMMKGKTPEYVRRSTTDTTELARPTAT